MPGCCLRGQNIKGDINLRNTIPDGIDLFKFSNSSLVTTCETCSKLKIKAPELSNLNL